MICAFPDQSQYEADGNAGKESAVRSARDKSLGPKFKLGAAMNSSTIK